MFFETRSSQCKDRLIDCALQLPVDNTYCQSMTPGRPQVLRRLDYQPNVTGAAIAHYTDQQQAFDGFVFPTRRRVFRRNADNTANQPVALITLDIDQIVLR